MTKTEAKELVKWLCNPENIGNCEECPYNEGFSSWTENLLPCGQFHCWVALHCKEEDE